MERCFYRSLCIFAIFLSSFTINEIKAVKYYILYYATCDEDLNCEKCKRKIESLPGGVRSTKSLYAVFNAGKRIMSGICESCYLEEIESEIALILKKKMPDLNMKKLSALIKNIEFLKGIPMTVCLSKPSIKYCNSCNKEVNVLRPYYCCRYEHFFHLSCAERLITKFSYFRLTAPILCTRSANREIGTCDPEENKDDKFLKCFCCKNGILSKINQEHINLMTNEHLKSIVNKIGVKRQNAFFCIEKIGPYFLCVLIFALILKLV